jgi:hypothetical protein
VPTNLLPGYGRSQQNGYVKLSYSSGEPSLVTEGSVGIETLNPQATLDVNGSIKSNSISTINIYDIFGSAGSAGQVLTASTSGIVWGTAHTLQFQVLSAGESLGGGGDEVQIFEIPSYTIGKTYRATCNFSIKWTAAAPAPAATDAMYFLLTPNSNNLENGITTNWTYLTDIQNAGVGDDIDNTYANSFSVIFTVPTGGPALGPPRIFAGSSDSTGSSGTPLPITILGSNTNNIVPTSVVWEQLN